MQLFQFQDIYIYIYWLLTETFQLSIMLYILFNFKKIKSKLMLTVKGEVRTFTE